MNTMNTVWVKVLFAILIPPIGVFLDKGIGTHLFVNIVLTMFGYIPGIIHGLIIVGREPDREPIPLRSIEREAEQMPAHQTTA